MKIYGLLTHVYQGLQAHVEFEAGKQTNCFTGEELYWTDALIKASLSVSESHTTGK